MSLFSLDPDFSMTALYYFLNTSSFEVPFFRLLPRLAPLTPEDFAIIAEPTTTFLLNADQLPRVPYNNLFFPVMTGATTPPTFTYGFYNETLNSQPISAFTNAMASLNGPAPSTKPQADGNTEGMTTESGGTKEKPKKSKKKPAPRYDRIWKCSRCDSKPMELTGAKKHEGLMFDDVMVEQPKKLRLSSVRY